LQSPNNSCNYIDFINNYWYIIGVYGIKYNKLTKLEMWGKAK